MDFWKNILETCTYELCTAMLLNITPAAVILSQKESTSGDVCIRVSHVFLFFLWIHPILGKHVTTLLFALMQSRSNRNKNRSFLFSNGVKNMDRFIVLTRLIVLPSLIYFAKNILNSLLRLLPSLLIDWLIWFQWLMNHWINWHLLV